MNDTSDPKRKEREQIALATEEFLARGGKITVVDKIIKRTNDEILATQQKSAYAAAVERKAKVTPIKVKEPKPEPIAPVEAKPKPEPKPITIKPEPPTMKNVIQGITDRLIEVLVTEMEGLQKIMPPSFERATYIDGMMEMVNLLMGTPPVNKPAKARRPEWKQREQVKMAMENNNISINAVAAMIGLSNGSLNKYLSGDTKPTADISEQVEACVKEIILTKHAEPTK